MLQMLNGLPDLPLHIQAAILASSLLGTSWVLPVSRGRLTLGTWQSVLLIEADGPRHRDIHMQLIPG